LRLRIHVFAILLSPLLALSTLLPSKAAHAAGGDTYGPWRAADGDGKIQYRWYTYGEGPVVPKCSYQLRNADSSDTNRYDASVDYTSVRGGNVTTSGPFLDKTYRENSGNIVGCTAITNIFMRRH
jgi:hypothetical protein